MEVRTLWIPKRQQQVISNTTTEKPTIASSTMISDAEDERSEPYLFSTSTAIATQCRWISKKRALLPRGLMKRPENAYTKSPGGWHDKLWSRVFQ
ncbi:unnamed protein product [Absidia cylindrospora]